MIRYYCDLCKKPIDSESEMRYVVKMEVVPAFPFDHAEGDDEDRDLIDELHQLASAFDDDEAPLVEQELHRELRFDLCEDCRRLVLANPLGRIRERESRFSTN